MRRSALLANARIKIRSRIDSRARLRAHVVRRAPLGKNVGAPDGVPSVRLVQTRARRKIRKHGHGISAANGHQIHRAASANEMAAQRVDASGDGAGRGRHGSRGIREGSRQLAFHHQSILQQHNRSENPAPILRSHDASGLDALGLPARRPSPPPIRQVRFERSAGYFNPEVFLGANRRRKVQRCPRRRPMPSKSNHSWLFKGHLRPR